MLGLEGQFNESVFMSVWIFVNDLLVGFGSRKISSVVDFYAFSEKNIRRNSTASLWLRT